MSCFRLTAALDMSLNFKVTSIGPVRRFHVVQVFGSDTTFAMIRRPLARPDYHVKQSVIAYPNGFERCPRSSPGCDVVRSSETQTLGFPRGSGAVPPNSRSPGIGIHKVIVTPR